MPNDRTAQGFTLLELLVVLTIAALTLGAALLWLPKTLASAQFRETVLQVRSVIHAAQTEARHRALPLTLWYDSATRTLYVENEPRLQVADGITLEWTVADLGFRKGVAAIRFWPEGGNTGGTVVVRRNDQATAIRLDWLLGHTETYAPAQ